MTKTVHKKTVDNDKEKQINMPDRTKITEETTITRMTRMTRVTRTTGVIRMIKMTIKW